MDQFVKVGTSADDLVSRFIVTAKRRPQQHPSPRPRSFRDPDSWYFLGCSGLCASSINLIFFACAISNEPLSPFITAVTQKEEVPPQIARVGSTRRRPSFQLFAKRLIVSFLRDP